MTEFKCEFCEEKFKEQRLLNIHKANSKSCVELQIKKLGRPLSEINKEKKAIEEARKAEKKAEKAKKDAEKARKAAEKAKKEAEKEKARKAAEKVKIEAEKEKARKEAEKAFREAEEEIARKAAEKENITDSNDNYNMSEAESEDEIDENAEIPFSSSEDESSSSSEDDNDEPYKVQELSAVQEVFNNIENYQRTNPARLNNLFKKKSTIVKTEIIKDDQPPEVHKRKIEEYLPSKVDVKFPEDNKDLKEISKVIEDKFIHLENKVMSSVNKLETKMNSMLDIIAKLEAGNEKRMKSIEREKIGIKDIENVIDDKLDDMFSITRKMLAEVESKSELLDIFRENMEDIIEKHYDLYKKFKYVKEDIEDMVYDKGAQRGSRRR